jgi:Dolichyl-phosphate-mannose-protein mannosyltransferase
MAFGVDRAQKSGPLSSGRMQGRTRLRRRLTTVLFAAAAILGTYAATVAMTGGFDIRVGGVRVRSHAWIRPALPAAILAGIWLIAVRRRLAAGAARAWPTFESAVAARALVAGAVLWTAAAGIFFGTFAAGGADSYGYVSQAMLLAEGRLTDTVPRDLVTEFRLPPWTLTPLGFVPGRGPAVIAPTYPPGFPLLMAPAAAVSAAGVYFVVPLFGILAIWLSYRLGLAMGDPLAGGVAAVLVSVSPTFVFQVVQPMGDVPVTAFWLASLLLATRGTAAAASGSGVAASIAILIRPNLAPLAVLPAALFVSSAGPGAGARLKGAAAYVAALIPAGAALAWIQYVRYGSALASGYGDLGLLFGTDNIVPNLAHYPRWLTDTHTPFIWLFLLGPAVLVRQPARARSLTWAAVLFSAIALAVYLPYVQFGAHEWTYSRFLLPAIPLMLLGATAAALTLIRRLPPGGRTAATLALFGGVAVFCLITAERRFAFELRAGEQRYVKAGEFVRQRLPENGIVLASQHSGSVRLYGRRPIVRWDLVARDELDSTVAKLRASGRMPFMVVDDFEMKAFRARFGEAGQRTVGEARLIRLLENVQIYAFD